MKINRWIGFLVLVAGVMLIPKEVSAGTLKAPEVFADGTWKYIGETGEFEEKGGVQSICATRDYIICLENASNSEATNDTLVAFYKNDYDLSGNPVEQYSYALHINEMDYEHGNGMTYNEKDNKVVIASGPVLDTKNLGTVYVLDAETLKFEEQIKVVDNGQSIWCIDYIAETDQYVVMTGYKDTFKFVLTDSEFRILDTLMEGDQSEGNKFQDFCISGDYLIGLPYFKGGRKEQRIQIYSLSERKWISNYPLILAEDMSDMEPEGICEVAPGHFILGSILRNPRRIGLYSLQVPVVYSIQTSIENGTISEGTTAIDYGDKFKVEYSPDEGYEVKEILVNGEQQEINKYISKYTFDDIDKDQTIKVICEKIPQYHIKGTVLNGSIDEETLVYEDTTVKVNFKPSENCRLKAIFVDGQLVESTLDAQYYEFEKIKEDHEIYVEFEKIPEYQIAVTVIDGYTSEMEAIAYHGEDYTAKFNPRKDYILKEILVDEKPVEFDANATSYKIKAVDANHTIKVVYQWQYLYVVIGIGSAVVLIGAGLVGSVYLKRAKQRKKRENEG